MFSGNEKYNISQNKRSFKDPCGAGRGLDPRTAPTSVRGNWPPFAKVFMKMFVKVSVKVFVNVFAGFFIINKIKHGYRVSK